MKLVFYNDDILRIHHYKSWIRVWSKSKGYFPKERILLLNEWRQSKYPLKKYFYAHYYEIIEQAKLLVLKRQL